MNELRLSTPVVAEKPGFTIGMDSPLFLMGSCFTENVGKTLNDSGFTTCINPFGIIYNPLSMAESLRRCLDDEEIGEEMLAEHDGLWHSWLHHGRFSNADKQACIDDCNSELHKAHEFLNDCNTVILTFGSAWLYKLVEDGTVVANCHKVPSTRFVKSMAQVDEIVNAWIPLVDRLLQTCKRVVFTVSPVRHSAYGAHGNQLGKAALLLAIDRLLSAPYEDRHAKGSLCYFPSYEIVVDELRDYRFYADDMNHPSPLAEKIVWQRFQETFMSPATIELCSVADKENRRSAHRPIKQNKL